MSTQEIAGIPAAASQLIDRLEKLEMVVCISDPGDRRVRKIVVLDKGKSFVQENFRFSQGWINEIPPEIPPEIEGDLKGA
jgi:DNA-binding MarR family transcriptional regulator